jgi:hypothetical protein
MVTQTGSTLPSLHFLVSVSPNYSITAGSAHHAFSFAIGNPSGVLTQGLGAIDVDSIVQTGGTGSFFVANNGAASDKNSPFKFFNYGINCTPNGGSQNCGQTLEFDFNFISAGLLIPSTSNGSIWFAADICVPNTSGGCSATGVAGATFVSQTQTTGQEVPGPIAGAGIPGLLAFVGLFAWSQRRRERIAQGQPLR